MLARTERVEAFHRLMTSTPASRFSLTFGALALALTIGALAPAAAQEMYPGQDVSINMSAAGGARTLLYPDGVHRVTLPRLLEPSQTSRGRAPIHLHMPMKRHYQTVHREEEPSPPVAETEAPVTREAAVAPRPAAVTQAPPQRPAPQPPTPQPPTPQPVAPEATETERPPTGQAAAIPFSFGGEGPVRSAPPPKPAAQPAPKPAPTTLASVKPPPTITPTSGETKQAAILFDQDSTTLSDSGNAQLKTLAFSLMTALTSGADQIDLVAYGGSPGDKSSSARRISLKRALAVREALIVYGVPAGRIDVRALGGVGDNGPTDRVDIFIKS